jgi:hypothetical protein
LPHWLQKHLTGLSHSTSEWRQRSMGNKVGLHLTGSLFWSIMKILGTALTRLDTTISCCLGLVRPHAQPCVSSPATL